MALLEWGKNPKEDPTRPNPFDSEHVVRTKEGGQTKKRTATRFAKLEAEQLGGLTLIVMELAPGD